jgi:hypothetical protein
MLVEPLTLTKAFIARDVEMALVNPIAVAAKIDEVASFTSDHIKEISNKMSALADARSWKVLRPKYFDYFNNL